MRRPPALFLLLALTACGPAYRAGNDGGTGGPLTDAGTTPPLGVSCTSTTACGDDYVCYDFGSGNLRCTLPCGSDPECPMGSQGKRCTEKGVCQP